MTPTPAPRPEQSDPAAPDSGVARQRCNTVQQAHPGWLIFHNSGTGAWSAYRRTFPDKQEIAAGVRLLIRADSAERLEGKLAAQAEILPAPEPLPGISWTFLRS